MRPITLITSLAVAILTACGQSTGPASLAPDAFEKAITAKAQLIDVRTPGEFSAGHLPDARNLDWTSGQLEASMGQLDKNAPVLVYCAVGGRSAAAREAMVKAGFLDVRDLAGGIQAWNANGKPIVR
ncbi:MAG: rhodanese-like domain-containing protein [Flavobacteriales bacterium]|nr:rhodanese-like domain-containing protein [Flavobacteriales bacterium]